MKHFRKITSLALCVAMIATTLPMAWSVQAEDEAETSGTTPVRVEAENFLSQFSSTSAKANTNSDLSEGKFLDNTRLNDIICLGEVDTTGLQSVTMHMTNANATATFDFYLDTAEDDSHKMVSLDTQKTADWDTYEDFSASVLSSVSAVQLVGQHTVYMKVSASSNGMHGGNIDYVDFTCAAPEQLAERTVTKNFNADIDRSLSTIGNGQLQKWDDAHDNTPCIGGTTNGHVLGYANVEFEDLKSITITHAHDPGAATVTVKMYRGESFDNATLLTSFEMSKNKINSGNWYDPDNYRSETFGIPDSTDMSGTDNLFFELITTTNNRGGNYSTFTLGYGFKTLNFVDNIDESRSSKPYSLNTSTSGNHFVESTGTGTVLAYSDIASEGLKSIELEYSSAPGFKMDILYGETLSTATTLATVTVGAGAWTPFVNSDSITLNTTSDLPEIGRVFFKLTSGRGNFKSFTIHYAREVFKSNKTSNFADSIDKDLSANTYSLNTKEAGNHFIEGTWPGTVLAYSDIARDGLKSIGLEYSSAQEFKMDILYGETVSTAATLATVTLNAGAWTPFVNSDSIALNISDNLPEKSTLFFKLTSGRGNFKNFTLHYAEDVSGAWEYQAESYSWGTSKTKDTNWVKSNTSTLVESPKNGDVFYLGEADVQDLEYITARVALSKGRAEGTYTFYADMDVDYANLTNTASGANHDRYQYTEDTQLSGGVQIGQMNITGVADNWTTFNHFYTKADVSSLSQGTHKIYMKVSNTTKGSDLGNIDYFRFGGMKKGSFNKDFSWTANVEFYGKYHEAIASNSAKTSAELKNLMANTTAPALGGYVFQSWDEPADHADSLYNAALANGSAVKLTATYVASGETPYHLSGMANMTAWNGEDPITSETELSFDTRVTVTKGTEKKVAYWVLDGAKVGFGADSYTFYISGNNNIAVVYVGEVEETVAPSVVLQQSLAPNAGSAYNFSVIAQTSIPNDASVSEYGVIYAASKEALEAVRNGEQAKTITVTSSKTGKNVQYMTHLLQVKAEKTRFAMAYAVVTVDGVEKTIYSDQYATVTTPTSGEATPTIESF